MGARAKARSGRGTGRVASLALLALQGCCDGVVVVRAPFLEAVARVPLRAGFGGPGDPPPVHERCAD
eukprot:3389608-Lingulodinium_polyedra.AAC.1